MNYRIRSITSPPRHHFFGYYDMRPWDPTGRFHLVLEVDFMDRPPTADDTATIGMVDLQAGNKFIPLTQTKAWNFQQGAMLHWLDKDTILLNDRRDGRFVCVSHRISDGRQQILGPATADVSEDLRLAATLNFARIAVTRPGYGYVGLADPFGDQNHTAQDGLGILDLKTGKHELVLNFADMHKLEDGLHGERKMYFNHVLFNPSATRLAVIVRWQMPDGGFRTRLWTVGVDGSNPVRLMEGPQIGHYDWKDDRTLIVWAQIDSVPGVWELDDQAPTKPRLLWGRPDARNGHVAYSHNRRWVINDTYPDAAGNRHLSIIEYATGKEFPLGTYYSPWKDGLHEIRCDFHPSFSPDDRQLAIDGMHEGTRQRYILDLELP